MGRTIKRRKDEVRVFCSDSRGWELVEKTNSSQGEWKNLQLYILDKGADGRRTFHLAWNVREHRWARTADLALVTKNHPIRLQWAEYSVRDTYGD
jgi:hypothetical protein